MSPVSGQWSRPGTGHTAAAPNLSAPNMEMLSKIYSLLHISHCQQQKHELCSNFFVSHVSACLVSRRVTRPAVPCLARTRSRWCGRCWSCTCRGWRGSSRGSCRRSTRAPQHIPSAGPGSAVRCGLTSPGTNSSHSSRIFSTVLARISFPSRVAGNLGIIIIMRVQICI